MVPVMLAWHNQQLHVPGLKVLVLYCTCVAQSFERIFTLV